MLWVDESKSGRERVRPADAAGNLRAMFLRQIVDMVSRGELTPAQAVDMTTDPGLRRAIAEALSAAKARPP